MDVAVLVAPRLARPVATTVVWRVAIVVVVAVVAGVVGDRRADDGADDDTAEDAEPKPKPAPLGVGRGGGQRAHGDGRGGHKREDGLLHRVFPPGSGSAGADRLATILKPVPAPVKEAGLICRKFDGLGSRPLSKKPEIGRFRAFRFICAQSRRAA